MSFYLLKRTDEKQCSVGERCMVVSDFSGVPAGTKGIVTEIYHEGVMITWEKDRVGVYEIRTALQSGDEFALSASRGFLTDGFSRDELEYLAFETAAHPKVRADVTRIL